MATKLSGTCKSRERRKGEGRRKRLRMLCKLRGFGERSTLAGERESEDAVSKRSRTVTCRATCIDHAIENASGELWGSPDGYPDYWAYHIYDSSHSRSSASIHQRSQNQRHKAQLGSILLTISIVLRIPVLLFCGFLQTLFGCVCWLASFPSLKP